MVEPLRHRQPKGAATDMFNLQPPRHISTLPDPALAACPLLRRLQGRPDVRRTVTNRRFCPHSEISLQLDFRELDHLGQLLRVFRDELTDLAGRSRERHGPEAYEPSLDVCFGKSCIDLFV